VLPDNGYRASIDAAAEAEGEAADRFAELTGDAATLSRSFVRHVRHAARSRWQFYHGQQRALGEAPQTYRNARVLAVVRWLEILDAIDHGKPLPKFSPYLKTRQERRETGPRRRAEKLARLAALERADLPESVSIAEAARLVGMSLHGLEKRVYAGDLPRHRTADGRGVVIRVEDLVRFQMNRLNAPRREKSPPRLAA
jgi:hypothetical protein